MNGPLLRRGLLLAGLIGLLPGPARALLIDAFTDSEASRVEASSTSPIGLGQVDDAAILGTQRDVEVRWETGPDLSEVAVLMGLGLAHSQDAGTTGMTAITWDGQDAIDAGLGSSGLGSINLLADGADSFRIVLDFSDLSGNLSVGIFSPGGASGAIVSFPGGVNSDTEILVPFASLSGEGDLTDVGAIQLGIVGSVTSALDVRLRRFETVPEPGAAALLLLTGAALAARRRAS